MKLIGLIGGTSWHSTIVYYRYINEQVGRRKGLHVNPPLLLYSLNSELMAGGDEDKIKHAYLHTARKLEIGGANAIIICANTPHLVYDFVQSKISIPILHIADATGAEAKEKGLRTLGLLGTRPTMTQGFIQKRLEEKFKIQCIVPEEEFMEEMHKIITDELVRGKFTEAAKSFFIDHMHLLKEEGAEGIILGCTELSMLLEQEDFPLPLLATTTLHAEMAVDFILR